MKAKRYRSLWALALGCGLSVCVAGCAWLGKPAKTAPVAEACDWSAAAWIGDGKPQPTNDAACYADDPAPQFRKRFVAAGTIRSAQLHIAGLGFYEAHLNGQSLSDTALAPLWTPYGKRVLFDTYDVTEQVQRGGNVLAVELGNGWYNPLPLRMWGHINPRAALAVGRPCLIAKLELLYADGTRETVASDTSWKVAEGPLLRNSLYLGEVYDARKETPGWRLAGYNEAAWRQASRVAGPAGALQPREAPPVSMREAWRAKQVNTPKPGLYVVDMGRNFAGLAQFKLGGGAAGERILFRYGELLNKDGTVNGMTAVCGQIKRAGVGGPGAPALAEQYDVYIRRGGAVETYAPRFTWHAFRYVQIEGLSQAPGAADVTAVALASALPDACEFECSSALFNDIHRMCRNTFLSNVFGVQSDCPARERFGYGADTAATTEAFILNFDMRAFYAKVVQDFADEAADDGWFTETAPYVGIADRGFGGRSGPIGWAVGVPVMMRDLYRYYGDRAVIAKHYAACARYVDLVKGQCPDLIVPQCIGDHEALEKAPEPLTATAHFYQWASLVSGFASILGKAEDAEKYGTLAGDIREAFQKKFVAGGKVGKGMQGAQVFGLYHRLVPDEDRAAALEILKKDIEAKGGALTTGIFGTKYLLEILSTEGLEDVAGQLVARREVPGWGAMLGAGATTLWENWKGSDNTFSQNHPMFGSVEEWLMKHVLGVSVAADAVGFDKVMIRPQAAAGVTWAKGVYRSVKGPVSVAWRIEKGRMKMKVELPPGVTAKVWLADEKKWVEVGAGKHEW
ncbi:MAG: family 78 glycoside hydrolase catalytic domain [bacterium]